MSKPIVKTVKLSDLVADPANVRDHPEKNKQAIAGSLQRFGAARSIVTDSKGVVRAGSGTLEAAKAAGIEEAIVIETDGKQVVVVKRPDWSDTEATAYAIADNKTNDLSEWNFEALSDTLRALSEESPELLNFTGFADYEIEPLLEADWKPPAAEDLENFQHGDGDKDGTCTVTFSPEQWETVREAVERVRHLNDDATIAPARALELMAMEFAPLVEE